jgi:predicted N-acetyltransferase YhbS
MAHFQSHLGKGQIPTTFVAVVPLQEQDTKAKEQTVVGSASLIARDMDTRPHLSPWLASLLVAPEHRGQGVGTALVHRVVQEAEALGTARLYLFAAPDKEGFYSRLGWKPLERVRYRGYQQIVMMLQTARA